jgi:hypothetical protein
MNVLTPYASATEAIQSAIDCGAATVTVPYTGEPWIVEPIRLRSDLRLVLEPGVVIEAQAGAFLDPHDSLFAAKNVLNVTIVGYGATLRMRKDDYTSPPYEPGEWRHGINLQGATNVVVRGLTIQQTGGDAIYIGPTWDDERTPCRDVSISDCILDQNYRQGISIVSGVGVRIENCRITRTAGKSPQAGIDLEPSHPMDKLTNILVRNCVAEGNAGSGFMANLSRLGAESDPVSARLEGCLVRDSVASGIRAILGKDYGATGLLEFINCTVQETQYAGLTVAWDTASPMELRFDNCRWSDVAKRADEHPLVLELVAATEPGGSIEFDATVFDRTGRPLIGINDGVFPDVTGNITAVGSDPGVIPGLPNLTISWRE